MATSEALVARAGIFASRVPFGKIIGGGFIVAITDDDGELASGVPDEAAATQNVPSFIGLEMMKADAAQ